MIGSVLIADDEPLARRTLREYLRDLGWTAPFHEARDGKAAIAIANKERPDLLFLDIVMPGANGLQVIEQLEYEPKVIFTTAYDEHAVAAFELGALDYVLKPFGRERLERVMQRVQTALNASPVPLRFSISGVAWIFRQSVQDLGPRRRSDRPRRFREHHASKGSR